ncbi:hypothetical protein [Myroides odoratimimus]|uniref:hypothetical protein n=1 Tax=Myroides odoratimimus TaxID=76832 RepID=UPI0025749FDE|nr:hypothetical protein [Myroides odoratimimus]
MIHIENNFLPQELFEELQNYCLNTPFERVKLGEKEFDFLRVPDNILPYLKEENHELIVTFIRRALPDFDTDLRIHADNIIQGEKTALAKVLYINPKGNTSKNGTAFWEHHTHGEELPEDVTNEEFDRLITEDSNDLSKWNFKKVFYSEPNKMVRYKANLFHSKYPAKITTGERIVLVAFYKDK